MIFAEHWKLAFNECLKADLHQTVLRRNESEVRVSLAFNGIVTPASKRRLSAYDLSRSGTLVVWIQSLRWRLVGMLWV